MKPWTGGTAYFAWVKSYEQSMFMKYTPEACTIKLFTAVIVAVS